MSYSPFLFTAGDVINQDRINSLHAIDLSDLNFSSTGAISWSKLDKASGSIADFSTRSAGDLTTGTLSLDRLSGITNTEIASGAGIAYSKLNLSGSLVDADVNSGAGVVYSKLNLSGAITNADISSSAAIGWSKISKTGSSLADFTTRVTSNLTDFPTQSGNSGRYLTTNGSSLSWATAAVSNRGLFFKENPITVVFEKTGNGTAQIKAGTIVDVNDTTVTFSSATSITMPTLVAGTDYAIWVKTDGTIQASDNHSSAPGAGTWRKIGGFHYAPGGNATAQSGGNTTPQINEYSFWDLKWRPKCSDPRGMTLVDNKFWCDIYLTGVDAITNGSSKYNVTIADGSSPPKVPSMYGGNGTTTYGSYTWFEAMELATAFGKKCPTQQEFVTLAYGTTEATSNGTDPVSTTLIAVRTSKWGVIQSTGVLYVWGRDRGGPAAAASWNANTEGRGSEFNAPNAAIFGGGWNNASGSGSRCSSWGSAASDSYSIISSRFVCDHLILD
jgi:hypothetical protein